MGSYAFFNGFFVLFGVLKYQTVTSDNIVKESVLTLQQILKMANPSSHEAKFLNTVSLKDISTAMSAVTNDFKQINLLIPKMFDVLSPNPAYVFSLPQQQGTRHSFLTMNRNNFEKPVFPNLTTSYVRFMRSKMGTTNEYFNKNIKNQLETPTIFEDKVNSNLVEENEPTLVLNLQTERNFIEFLNKVNQLDIKHEEGNNEGGSDEWTLLGLHGWQGILSKQRKEKQQPTLNENKSVSNNPIENNGLEWDLPGKMRTIFMENILLDSMKNPKIMNIVANVNPKPSYPITSMHGTHFDADVYIGRVNDPFGHSTKWIEKNSSSNTSIMEDRKKRGVIELYSMIKCSTGCDPIVFKGYGCYCGFLGDGIPVDGIDRCCRLHDKCYEYSNCVSYLEYFVPYIWKCYRGKPLCAIDHGEWGGPYSCAARLCHCDLNLSRCLRRFLCPHRRSICRTSKWRMLQNLFLDF